MVPAGGGPKTFEAEILLAAKAPKQNFGCQPPTLEGEEGGGLGGGGVTPPPPAVYGRSNTSRGAPPPPARDDEMTMSKFGLGQSSPLWILDHARPTDSHTDPRRATGRGIGAASTW